jgi:GT2 family glycosyltransferase
VKAVAVRALVSIVVVAYRVREPLLACLDSIAVAVAELERSAGRLPSEPGTGPHAELIVVDNGDLAELVRAHSPQARVLEPHVNLGFAGGVQLGIEAAAGSWVALVNDDATLEPDALLRLLERGASDPDIGAVAPQIRFELQAGTINSAGIDVDSLGVATERLAGAPVERADQPCEVFGVSGCVALYRGEMLAQIGGFDTEFFAYLEDVDVAWRARAAGWRAFYEPAAVAHHRGSASSGEGSARKYYLVGRNRVRLLARNATTRQLVVNLIGILCYDSAYVLYVALSDRTLAPLRGRLSGLRRWRAARRSDGGDRRDVPLSSPLQSWRRSLSQHRAYQLSGSRPERA